MRRAATALALAAALLAPSAARQQTALPWDSYQADAFGSSLLETRASAPVGLPTRMECSCEFTRGEMPKEWFAQLIDDRDVPRIPGAAVAELDDEFKKWVGEGLPKAKEAAKAEAAAHEAKEKKRIAAAKGKK